MLSDQHIRQQWAAFVLLAAGLTSPHLALAVCNPPPASGNLAASASCTGSTGTNAATPGQSTDNASDTNNRAETIFYDAQGDTAQPLFLYSTAGNGYAAPYSGVDNNGNPDFYVNNDTSGSNGGSAGAVTLTNNGELSLTTEGEQFSGGADLVYGLSSGGNGGAGKNGTNGGYAGNVSVTDSNDLSLDWTWTNPANTTAGLIGIYAKSQGGNGSLSETSNVPGGYGGSAGAAMVTLSQDAAVSLSEYNFDGKTTVLGSAPGLGSSLAGAGIAALSNGGAAGAGYDTAPGGSGGNAAAASINVNGGTVSIYDPNPSPGGAGASYIAGLLARSTGGNGGPGGLQQNNDPGGGGGAAGQTSIVISGPQNFTTQQIYTNGYQSPGVVAASIGGTGGQGTDYSQYAFNAYGGDGAGGGASQDAMDATGAQAAATVLLESKASILTLGYGSPGITVTSSGGNGGNGGNAVYEFPDVDGFGGNGGGGGAAGDITATLQTGSQIVTQAAGSAGILAASYGGAGGQGGSATSFVTAEGGKGGAGGNSGNVTVTVNLGSTISTYGNDSSAIIAQSESGYGGSAGSAGAAVPITENGGSSGNTGNVYVVNNGLILTAGIDARGILAQNFVGAGGGSNAASGVITYPGDGGTTGIAGLVDVTNQGTIITGGASAYGIEAQNIGGTGGAGGTESGVIQLGNGDGSAGAQSGGAVNITAGGLVETYGDYAYDVVGQSIGGGGGDGGASNSLFSVGGAGGGGGVGGNVSIDSSPDARFITNGDLADALVAQSIGGGGGNGGNATTYSTTPVALSIGGTGGAGGNGGNATVSTAQGTSLTLNGSNGIGILAQSIGGGGGNGGAAQSTDYSFGIGVAVAIGGSGGGGGNGGTATASLNDTSIITNQAAVDSYVDPNSLNTDDTQLNPLPIAAYGVVAESIGGGGGNGGAATAKSLVANLPVNFNPVGGASFSLSTAAGVGGSGAVGGNASTALVNLSNGASITTNGSGSHGVVAESIGGGGGNGGDGSAQASSYGFRDVTSVTGRKAYNLSITVGNGGSGAGGGNGGTAAVAVGGTHSVNSNGVPVFTADPAGANASNTITTLGDDSDAVYVDSTGGGGGNAGIGSGSTQNANSSSTSLTLTISAGVSGGGGGNGGLAQADLGPDAVIGTAGSSSDGMLVQSVGGGGGASQGGSYSVGLPSIASLGAAYSSFNTDPIGFSLTNFLPGYATSTNVTLKMGGTGTGGGDGGAVNVNAQAKITTYGDDADGILAQSVGGGGGVAGSAGSDGSADNPFTVLGTTRKFVDEASSYLGSFISLVKKDAGNPIPFSALKTVLPTLNFNLSIGATGGPGGKGGQVNVNALNASITTHGDDADGIQAESVGGGGGTGGAATAGGASGLGTFQTVNFNLAMGGSGGTGGTGGNVNVTVNNTVISTGSATGGFAAYGVFAQSVGGGGGSTGSAETFPNSGYVSLGYASGSGLGSDGGAGSNGGAVSFTTNSNITGAGDANITTLGDAAHALFLQSVGGGGGVAAMGATFAFDTLELPTSDDTGSYQLSEGGGAGAGGSGGAVSINNAFLILSTKGRSAYGILAQSIGGGGGVIAAFPSDSVQNANNTAISYEIGGNNSTRNLGNGGAVTINPQSALYITTTGAGSDAILAQSIGGGGGINAYLPGVATLAFSPNDPDITNGDGGNVTINTGTSSIITTGASADGIFAQSIGAGGGLEATSGGTTLEAGSSGAFGSNGRGGVISITQTGTLSATGENSIGIFAQDVGQTYYGAEQISGGITINVNGSVQGGSGVDGYGIWTDSDATNAAINVNKTGVVSSVSGNAINATGYGYTDIVNYGTVIGNININTTSLNYAQPNAKNIGIFHNFATASLGDGVLESGGILNGELDNNGLLETTDTCMVNCTDAAMINTTIADNYKQVGGTYAPRIDFTTQKGELLTVNGVVSGSGYVDPIITGNAVTGVAVPFLAATYGLSPSIITSSATVGNFSISQNQNNVNELVVTLNAADFASPALALSKNQRALGQSLNAIFQANHKPELDPLLTQLINLGDTDAASYGKQLAALTPGASLAIGARNQADLQSFSNTLMSCPSYNGSSAAPREASCVWLRGIGRAAHQSGADGDPGFQIDETGFQIGGQKEFTPGWFFGGAAAYGETWMNSDDAINKAHGDTGYGGIVLKHELGNWLFAAAAYGSYGDYSNTRFINIPGFLATAQGSPSTYGLGIRLRAAYTVTIDHSYIRPYLNLDDIYVSTNAYRETNGGAANLDYKAAGQDIFIATPTLEIGQRLNLPGQRVARLFASAGISLLSSDQWKQSARFAAASNNNGAFDSVMPLDNVVGHLQAGAQLMSQGPLGIRLQYDGEVSQHVSSNAGTLTASYRF